MALIPLSPTTMVNTGLASLAEESITHILEYLRAIDFASCCEVNKAIFLKVRILKAIRYQLQHIYNPILLSLSPITASSSTAITPHKPMSTNYSSTVRDGECRCDVLYVREVKTILTALNYSQSQLMKGYWVSTSWLSNTKKYFEALTLPDIQIATVADALNGSFSSSQSQYSGNKKNSSSANKKQSKIRQRRGSDSLPPWPCMNSDITCCHGNLSVAKTAKSKRKLIDKKVWFCLRKFYPKGPQFKSTLTTECSICLQQEQQSKTMSEERKGAQVALRQILFEDLQAVAMRKSGVPSHLLTVTLTRPPRTSDTGHQQAVSSPSFATHTSTAQLRTGSGGDIISMKGGDSYSSYSAEDDDDDDYDDTSNTEDNDTEDNGSTSGQSVDYNDYDFASITPYVLSRAHSRSQSESSLTPHSHSPFAYMQQQHQQDNATSSSSSSTLVTGGVAESRSLPLLLSYRDTILFPSCNSGATASSDISSVTPLRQPSNSTTTEVDANSDSSFHFKAILSSVVRVDNGFGNFKDDPIRNNNSHIASKQQQLFKGKGSSKGKGKGGKVVISLEQFLQQTTAPLTPPPSFSESVGAAGFVNKCSSSGGVDSSVAHWYTPAECSAAAESAHVDNYYAATTPCHSVVHNSGGTEYNYKTANNHSSSSIAAYHHHQQQSNNTDEDADVALALSLQLQFDQEAEAVEEEERIRGNLVDRIGTVQQQQIAVNSGNSMSSSNTSSSGSNSGSVYSYSAAVASSNPNYTSSSSAYSLAPSTVPSHHRPRQPLLPGVYHIIPRDWLRQWRRWLKGINSHHSAATSDFNHHIPSTVPSHLHTTDSHSHYKPNSQPPPSSFSEALPVLDCTGLLCHAHGKLIVPPHLDEYLRGHRKNLLAGLGHYKGEVVEVLSGDEFDAMQLALSSLGSSIVSGSGGVTQQQSVDFNIRFAVSAADGDNRSDGVTAVAWSIETCYQCDPFNYKNLLKHSKTNKGRPISSLML